MSKYIDKNKRRPQMSFQPRHFSAPLSLIVDEATTYLNQI